jgi:hypothetical protein
MERQSQAHPKESGMNDLLNWDVFVTPGIPTVTSDPPPGTKQLMWSPISSTLISGEQDAVLVDAFITVEQTDTLVDWVASGKNLTTIYFHRNRERSALSGLCGLLS